MGIQQPFMGMEINVYITKAKAVRQILDIVCNLAPGQLDLQRVHSTKHYRFGPTEFS
jgi:hypothetical protein